MESEIFEKCADLENEIFKKCADITNMLAPETLDKIRVAAATELARLAGRVLGVLARLDDPEEHFAEVIGQLDGPIGEDGTAGAAIGHFVMQAFGAEYNYDGDVCFTSARKHTLINMIDILGPDHLEALRKQVAFMMKVDGFR